MVYLSANLIEQIAKKKVVIICILLKPNLRKFPPFKKLIEELVIILSPFVPHIAEEFWSLLGHSQTISYQSWPQYKEDLIQLDEVAIAVQVNGKLRANINVAKDSNESDVISEAMLLENVKKFTSEGNIIKTIYVANRLLNFVVK